MKVILKNVRLSFAHLFKATDFNGDGIFAYEATFLMEKGSENQTKVEAVIADFIKNEFKGKGLPADKVCLQDGDFKDYDGYTNQMYIKAKNKIRVPVVNRKKEIITEEDGVLYSGCYVNVSLDVWPQNNQWGKRINAKLLGVQFAADGTPFSGGATLADDDFEDFGDEAESEDMDWAA